MYLLLENAGFRRLWLSSFFSDIHTVTFLMSQGLLTLHITDSAFWVGAVVGFHGVTLTLGSFIGGVLTDRFYAKRSSLITGATLLDFVAVLFIVMMMFFGEIKLWHLILAAVMNGLAISHRSPARSALTLDLVGRKRLVNAIAVNLASWQVTAISAPIIAGTVITIYDLSWAYVLTACAAALAFISILTLKTSIPTDAAIDSTKMTNPFHSVIDGVKYVFTVAPVRSLVFLIVVVEIFLWSHESMLPVMAEKVLEVGPLGLGSILSLGGVGALISLVFISSFKDIDPTRLLLVVTLGLFSTCLVLFAFSPWFPLSLGLIALAYAFGMGYETIISALLLIVVQKRMRGRVLSFQTVAWGGFGIPGFFMGTIGGTFSASIAIATGGIVVLIYTLINLRTLLKADRPD